MDFSAVGIRNTTNQSHLLLKKSLPTKPIAWNFIKATASSSSSSFYRPECRRVLEIKLLKRKVSTSSSGYTSSVVRAISKKNHDNSSSSGDADRLNSEGDSVADGNNTNNTSFHQSHHVNMDWREFRANLFRREQAEKVESTGQNDGMKSHEPKPLGVKWAHPIPIPETGCVLVATEKLDGVRAFERTVVLLLRSGTQNPQEGPFGIIINRPLRKQIKHMKPTNLDLATTFSDSTLHFGGPLEASIFLLKTGDKSKIHGFEEVIPGLCFGARNSLDEAAGLVKKGILKPQDFRFFVGYAGWQLDQLREEIESDYWHVASCSSNLIRDVTSESRSEGLWGEILQLMGGHYSDLGRKPKQDM